MPLTRNFQVAVKVEDQWATPDSAATLFAAGNMAFLPINPSIEFTPQFTERDINQGTLTPAKSIPGLITGNFKVTHELLSSSTAYTLAPLLRGCGLLQVAVVKIKVAAGGIKKNSAAAYLKHGTKVYYGTAAAVPATQYLTIMGDYYDGDEVVFAAYDNSGDLNYRDFLWKAGAGGATAPAAGDKVTDDDTETALTETAFEIDEITLAGGQAFCPVSRPLHRISVPSAAGTVTITKGDVLRGVVSGSRWQSMITITTNAADNLVLTVANISGHLSAAEELRDETAADAVIGDVAGTVDAAEKQLAACSIGAGIWKDGVREAISSARGTPTFRFPVGAPATVEFDYQGVKSVVEDAAGTTGIVFPDLIPPVWQNTNLVLGEDANVDVDGEYAPCVASVEFSLANDLSQRQCSNAEFGVLEYEITGRSPTGKVDPELYQEAVFETLGNFLDSVNGRLFFKFARPTPENRNKFWFWVPSFGVTGMPTGDRNGRATREISFAPNTGSAGYVSRDVDNDFVLVMDGAAASYA